VLPAYSSLRRLPEIRIKRLMGRHPWLGLKCHFAPDLIIAYKLILKHLLKLTFMTNKLKMLIAAMWLGLCAISCEEIIPEETLTGPLRRADQALAGPLIFEETFEGPAPLHQAHNTDFGSSHSFALVTAPEPVFQGSRAARIKLKASDPMLSGGTRAEVTVVGDSVKEEMWYSFAMYFSSAGFELDSTKEIISQWHQLEDAHLGEQSQSPATHLLIHKDNFILGVGYSKDSVSKGVDPDYLQNYDLGPVTKDTWHEFVFHFIHSYQDEGLVEVWHNGTQKVHHLGGNMYNNVLMPKWKVGIYKWKWNGEDTTNTRKRIVYLDNIRVGNKTATLADMAPATPVVTTPAEPDTTINYSFTFVNAETDTDIVTFTQGAILSLNTLGTNRITLRADTKLTKVGSVEFMLKGAKTYSGIDSEPPFALFGDDGLGNYYYGSLLPPGEYSLKVYPYVGKKGTGKPRPAFSTSFTIKKY
jgi:Polysaccharide lyase